MVTRVCLRSPSTEVRPASIDWHGRKSNLRRSKSVGTLDLFDGFATAPTSAAGCQTQPAALWQRTKAKESFCAARHPRRFAVEIQGAADSGAEVFPGVIEDGRHDVPHHLALRAGVGLVVCARLRAAD